MVVDKRELTASLTRFYACEGKSAVCVGAGGGLLLPPSSGVTRVVGIDRDAEALRRFRADSKGKWEGVPIRFVPRLFETVRLRGDVVYFEFCMHMMKSPRGALEHARALARDVVVMDHLPGSEWVYYWAGEEEVARSTRALESFGVRRRKTFSAEQRFADGAALAERLAEEGDESKRRVLGLKGAKDIRIRMDYGLYLL